MKANLISIIFVLFLVCSILSKPVRVDVIFEIRCGESRRFVTRSFSKLKFVPGWEKYLEVNLWAYGNASQRFEDGKWKFTCQHGESECLGNMIITCSQKILKTDVFNKFVVCFLDNIMENDNQFETVTQCSSHNVSNQLEDCVNDRGSFKGSELQHHVAVFTHGLTVKHEYVPHILVEGVNNINTENYILGSIKNYACLASKGVLFGCEHQDSFIQFDKTKRSKNMINSFLK